MFITTVKSRILLSLNIVKVLNSCLLRIALIIFGLSISSYSQVTLISSTDTIIDLRNQTLSYIDEKRSIQEAIQIDEKQFDSLSNLKIKSFYSKVRFCQWLKIKVSNQSESSIPIQFYFGKYSLIKLFQFDSTLRYIASAGFTDYQYCKYTIKPNYGFKVILSPHELSTYYIQIEHYGRISGKPESKIFVNSTYDEWIQKNEINNQGLLIFHLLVLGGIFTLALFMLIYFFSNKIPEYLFYSLYSFSMFFFLERAFEINSSIRLISQFYPYYFYQMPTIINLIAAIFYILFIQHFTELKIKQIKVYKLSKHLLKIIIASLCIFCLLLLFCYSSRWIIPTNFILNFLAPVGMLVLVLTIYTNDRKNKLNNFIFIGFALLFISVILSILLNNFTEWATSKVPPATYLEVGVLCEMLCLALGLGYKSKMIEKTKNETEILNLQLKIENITNIENLRSEISRDLHDDIGSTLSSINILSRTTKNKLLNGNSEKVFNALEKINDRSQRLLEKMSDIIWNIKPDNDSMAATMSRMREYSTALLEAQNIQYTFAFPTEHEYIPLSIKVKSAIYLIFKEAVNNLVKYAECSHVNLTMTYIDNILVLSIEDNGKGFDLNQITHYGGLLNMEHRASEVNGTLSIHSVIGQGTKIELSIPLSKN